MMVVKMAAERVDAMVAEMVVDLAVKMAVVVTAAATEVTGAAWTATRRCRHI